MIVKYARWALNYIHGEYHRSFPISTSKGLEAEKVRVLSWQTQRPLETAASATLGATRAIRPHEALAGLLKGRCPYQHLSSSTVMPCEVSQVALPKAAASVRVSSGSLADVIVNNGDFTSKEVPANVFIVND